MLRARHAQDEIVVVGEEGMERGDARVFGAGCGRWRRGSGVGGAGVWL